MADQEWTNAFHVRADYEVQVSEEYLAYLKKLRQERWSYNDIADEIVSGIATRNVFVNVLGCTAELDFPEEVLKENG
jgi:hypothetical protein